MTYCIGPNCNVSIESEIPAPLHNSLNHFLEQCPEWSHDRVVTAALSLFLLQNRMTNDKQTARIYLDSLFKVPVVTDDRLHLPGAETEG
jgi:hypothetical protein